MNLVNVLTSQDRSNLPLGTKKKKKKKDVRYFKLMIYMYITSFLGINCMTVFSLCLFLSVTLRPLFFLCGRAIVFQVEILNTIWTLEDKAGTECEGGSKI